jgi:hypothetical protein
MLSQVYREVKKYANQVLEELDTEQADTFRSADQEIMAKETLLRYSPFL